MYLKYVNVVLLAGQSAQTDSNKDRSKASKSFLVHPT